MAAPTFFQQGNLAVVTTGNLTVTIPPVELADDILVVTTVAWIPNTTTGANTIAAPSGWTKFTPAVTTITGGLIDAEYSFFWKRAVGADADPVFVRPTGWDTGTDTNWSGRCYIIRGCPTTGDPWDTITNTAISTAANPAFPAITVSGNERLAIVFAVKSDNAALPTAATGYTTQLELTTTTGTDAAVNSYTIASRNTSVSAVTPTGGVAPAQGGTVYFGVSFKPTLAVVSRTATGFGTGTQTGNDLVTVIRTATGSGLGSGSGDDQLTHDRNASGSGAGTQSAAGSILVIIDRTATGVGSSDQFAYGLVPVTYNRTAFGAGSGTQSAVWVRSKRRTARGTGVSDTIDYWTADGFFDYGSGTNTTSSDASGQSFVGNGSVLAFVQFPTYGSIVYNDVYAGIYAHTGTFGSNGIPTGPLLASSYSRVLGTTNTGFVTFEFDGNNRILLQNGVNYCVVLHTNISGGTLWFQNAGGFFTDSGNSVTRSRTSGIWSSGTGDYAYKVLKASATSFVTRVRTAIGSGTGSESASGAIVVPVTRTATGSGVGTMDSTGLVTRLRTATGSGTGTESATGFKTVFRTAVGSGAGTSTADTLHNNIRSASGAGGASPSAIAIGFVTAVRTASGSGVGTSASFGLHIHLASASGSGLGSSVTVGFVDKSRTASGFGSGSGFTAQNYIRVRLATGSGVGSAQSIGYVVQSGMKWSYWGSNLLLT